MKSGRDKPNPCAIIALAFTLVFFAACNDGRGEGDAAAAPMEPSTTPSTAPSTAPTTAPPTAAPVAQPGVFRTIADWAGSPFSKAHTRV